MTTMTYDGYVATLEFDEKAGIINGRVVNANSVLTFEGETVAELRTAFADTIADYLDWCKERGEEPDKPYSGTLSLRIDPELHRRLAVEAASHNESLNQFIAEQLGRSLGEIRLSKDLAAPPFNPSLIKARLLKARDGGRIIEEHDLGNWGEVLARMQALVESPEAKAVAQSSERAAKRLR